MKILQKYCAKPANRQLYPFLQWMDRRMASRDPPPPGQLIFLPIVGLRKSSKYFHMIYKQDNNRNRDFFILVLIQMSSKYSCICFRNLSWVVKWLFPVEAKWLSSNSLSEVLLVKFYFHFGFSFLYVPSKPLFCASICYIYSFIYFSLNFRISGHYLFVYNVFVLFSVIAVKFRYTR